MAGNTSKLEPFRDFIAAERRKRTPYRRIAELLAEKNVQVDYSTIHAFVRVRSKPPRKVITMLEVPNTEVTSTIQESTAVAEVPRTAPTSKAHTELSGQLDAIQRLKQAKPRAGRSGQGLPSFREDAPLDRLPDEEARRLRRDL